MSLVPGRSCLFQVLFEQVGTELYASLAPRRTAEAQVRADAAASGLTEAETCRQLELIPAMLRAMGVIVGVSIHNEVPLGINFAPHLCRQMLNDSSPPSLEDLKYLRVR